jgi:TetR/AcrR family transcriptional regulator, transcriptional repressor for nem operon
MVQTGIIMSSIDSQIDEPMKTKRGEKEKLRTVILGKAVSCLKKYGRGEAGTHKIMKYAGLSRGALYSHFKSKDDLFAQAVCYDLQILEDLLAERFKKTSSVALKGVIEDHLSEKSMTDIEKSCVFTSLSTDMQRSKAADRAMYEKHMERIYGIFADALATQFPGDDREASMAKAVNLYSALVGTLTMARTIKAPKLARDTLEWGRKYLIQTFVPKASA